jgi:hypothetical protein
MRRCCAVLCCVPHRERLGLADAYAYELCIQHGTCLRGLEKEGIPHDREQFLKV